MSRRGPEFETAGLVASALDLLLSRRQLGFIWLDASLTVVAATGLLHGATTVGEALSGSLPVFLGMEAGIESLKDMPRDSSVTLPNIAVRDLDGEAPKVDLEVRWLGVPPLFLVVVARGVGQSGLELELRREMRARRIAESLLVEKSRQIEIANKDLARANRDLEEFAYVIAHDLKAPLRAMRLTAERLESELGSGGSQAAGASLALIRQQSRRMSQMLSGLLEYARIGRKKEVESEVDARLLAGEIAASCADPGGIGIEIEDGDWPRFVTLREPLDVVLRNLVENAVKHHDRAKGAVRIKCADRGESWEFAVEDDGPGIPREYHAAIFEPFRRIDDDGASEGSGIGLALVKKTAELVGGSIELVSDPAKRRGSVFRVRWPKVIAG